MDIKQIKKWLIVSFTIVSLLFIMPESASADDAIAILRISPPFVLIDNCPSSELEIEIRVEDVIDLYAYHLEISFTPGVVEVLDVQNGTFLESGFLEPSNAIDNINGSILFGMSQIGGEGKSGSGDLVIIRLRAINPFLSSQFEIDAVESDLVHWEDYLPIPFLSFTGTVSSVGCNSFNNYLPMIIK